jgi:diadenosine tetraphosphate (Ap4A) HIT family hydrolase
MSCELCVEAETGYLTLDGEPYSRTLMKTEDFTVFPALGPLTDGHLLIIANTHYRSFATMPSHMQRELERTMDVVRNVLKQEYAPPLFFEHGEGLEGKGGACIDHAHLHAIPNTYPILESIMEEFPSAEIRQLSDLPRHVGAYGYLFVEQSHARMADEERRVFPLREHIRSQYIRRKVAAAQGDIERWDWAVFPGYDKVKEIKDTLKDAFADR